MRNLRKYLFNLLIGLLIFVYLFLRHYPHGGLLQSIVDLLALCWIVQVSTKLILHSFKKA